MEDSLLVALVLALFVLGLWWIYSKKVAVLIFHVLLVCAIGSIMAIAIHDRMVKADIVALRNSAAWHGHRFVAYTEEEIAQKEKIKIDPWSLPVTNKELTIVENEIRQESLLKERRLKREIILNKQNYTFFTLAVLSAWFFVVLSFLLLAFANRKQYGIEMLLSLVALLSVPLCPLWTQRNYRSSPLIFGAVCVLVVLFVLFLACMFRRTLLSKIHKIFVGVSYIGVATAISYEFGIDVISILVAASGITIAGKTLLFD